MVEIRPRVFQLNASNEGGVPKLAVPAAHVGPEGFSSDAVAHPKIHGGPERAVCLYALERILALQEEGHFVFPGAVGENVTTVGVDFADLAPGDRLQLGPQVLLEITRYTTPCRTIAPFFRDGDSTRIHQDRFPGWSRVYAKVVKGGMTRVGDAIVRRPNPQGTLPPA